MQAATGQTTHEAELDARNENILIYIDGALAPRREAKVSVYDSGFLLGDGVWEGLRVHDGKLSDFKALCEQFVAKTRSEPACLFYGFSFDGDRAHCREGYRDAAGLLAHLENVGALLQEALKIADITRLEVHGPESELDKLRQPLADLKPEFFTLEYGFRR